MSRYRVAGVDLGQANDPAAMCVLEREVENEGYGPFDPVVKIVGIRQFPLGLDYTVLCDELLTFDLDAMVVEYNGVGRPVVDILRRRANERGYQGRIHPVVTAASHIQAKMVTESRGRKWVVPKQELISSINVLQRQGGHASCAKCGTLLPAVGMQCTALADDACKVKIMRHEDKWVAEGFHGSHHGPYTTKEEARQAVKQLPSEGRLTGGGLRFPSRDKVPEVQLLFKQLEDFERRQNDNGAITFGNRPGRNRHDDLVIALALGCWWILRFCAKRKELAVVW